MLEDTGADADLADLAKVRADLHRIADAHGSLEGEQQAGDEVVDDVLQTEADADAQRAAENGEAAELDARGSDGEKERSGDEGIAHEGPDRDGHSAPEIHPIEDVELDDAGDEASEHDPGPQHRAEEATVPSESEASPRWIVAPRARVRPLRRGAQR